MLPSVSGRASRVHGFVEVDGLPALLFSLRSGVVPLVRTGRSGWSSRGGPNARHPAFTRIESHLPGNGSLDMADGRIQDDAFKRAVLLW